MNYKSFLRQQLCILVRGADGGRESVSLQILMVAEMLCFRGFRGVVSCMARRSPCLLVYGFYLLRLKVTNNYRHHSHSAVRFHIILHCPGAVPAHTAAAARGQGLRRQLLFGW